MNLFTDADRVRGVLEWSLDTTRMVPFQSPPLNRYTHGMHACEVWGSSCDRKQVLFYCDNQTIVHLWKSGLSGLSRLMHVVHALFFVAAKHNSHIYGTDNSLTDALSHFQVHRLAPQVDHPDSTPIPAHLTFHSLND